MDAELAVRLGLETASAPDGGDDWVAIPYRRSCSVVNRKYRRVAKATGGGPSFVQDKGGEPCWRNHDAVTDPSLAHEPLLVTEGEFDAMAAMQAGGLGARLLNRTLARLRRQLPGGERPCFSQSPRALYVVQTFNRQTHHRAQVTAARHRLFARLGWDSDRDRLADAPEIRAVVPEPAHATIFKALRVLGFGLEGYEPVAP